MDKADVLRLTDKGLDVFKHYILFPFRIGCNYFYPLYKDSKASYNIYFDQKNEVYKVKDFGNDDYSEDCFTLVEN